MISFYTIEIPVNVPVEIPKKYEFIYNKDKELWSDEEWDILEEEFSPWEYKQVEKMANYYNSKFFKVGDVIE